jgi:hypothetical protein
MPKMQGISGTVQPAQPKTPCAPFAFFSEWVGSQALNL